MLGSRFYQERVILVAFTFHSSSVLDLSKAIICSTSLKGMQTHITVINGFVGAGKKTLIIKLARILRGDKAIYNDDFACYDYSLD